MFVADNPAASSPSSVSSAGRKSPVESPRKYKTGRTSATFGERRMYGGKIRLVNRHRSPSSSTRRSFTRGARTSNVPAPQVTPRARACPLRTTSRRPSASHASMCRSKYAATSSSSALTSIRLAPSRASASSV